MFARCYVLLTWFFSLVPAELGTGMSFSSSNKEGAVLVLPDGADHRDLCNLDIFHQAAAVNARAWYEHANGPHGRRISNRALYLVTGSDKGSSWANASYSGASEGREISLKLKFTQIGGVNAGYSYSWEHHSPVEARFGPRGDAPIWSRNHGNVTAARNQCVFIRGFKITVREHVLLPKASVKLKSIIGATAEEILPRGKGEGHPFLQGRNMSYKTQDHDSHSGSTGTQTRMDTYVSNVNLPNEYSVEMFPNLLEVYSLQHIQLDMLSFSILSRIIHQLSSTSGFLKW